MSDTFVKLARKRRWQSGKYVNELRSAVLSPSNRYKLLKYNRLCYFGRLLKCKLKKLNKKKIDQENLEFNVNDCLSYRYQILSMIGHGGFGTVVEALDHKKTRMVAIKCMQLSLFDCQREIQVMRHLVKCNATDYAVQLYDNFEFKGYTCLVLEKLRIDLHTYMLWHKCRGMSPETISIIGYEIFKCLHVLHDKCGVLHCDLKPENILFVQEGSLTIKLADFGLSCKLSELPDYKFRTTLYYKAPEVMLGGIVSAVTDVWAVGCILAEMFSGEPLFFGADDFDQMSVIMGVCDMPDEPFLDSCCPDIVAKYIDEGGLPKYCAIIIGLNGEEELVPMISPNGEERYLPGDNPLNEALTGELEPECLFLDLINKCLLWDPYERISALEAMYHPYFRRRVSSSIFDIGNYPQFTNQLIECFDTASEILEPERRDIRDRSITGAF